MMKTRLLWPDYTKALAIWLVVFCHANVSVQWLYDYILMFHMPVFFVISGYFDKGEKLSKKSFMKFFQQLIVPYFFFNFLALSICWVSPYLHPELYPGQQTFYDIFKSSIVGIFLFEDRVTYYSLLPNMPLWFLPALFIIKLLFSLSFNISSYFNCPRQYLCLVFIAFTVLGSLIVSSNYNLFSIHSAFLSFTFYAVGWSLRKTNILEKLSIFFHAIFYRVSIIVVILLYLYYVGLTNGSISIDGCCYGNSIISFYINGFLGFLCVFFIFSSPCISSRISFFQKIGQSTITILGTHLYFCIFGKVFAISLGYQASEFPLFIPFIIATLSCVAGVYIHQILCAYFPLSIGKRKLN